MKHQDLYPDKLLKAELDNLHDEGCADQVLLADIQSAIARSMNSDESNDLWQRIDAADRVLRDNPQEPSDLQRIQACRPKERRALPPVDKDALADKVYGAWLARCAGCTLGKPVEGWPREKIRRYLQEAGAYPLHFYIPALNPFPEGLELWENYTDTTLGNISRMVRDDDIDYTVLALKTLETCRRDFTSMDIGRLWLENLPYKNIFTAEAIAYRNLVNEMDPPLSAYTRNPYREFIGAQIRGDMWGYVNPGRPERAAEMAFRDACVSHTKNGIYGEMWAAACIAAALVLDDPHEIVQAGLAEIPAECRLAVAIRNTMNSCNRKASWEAVWDEIQRAYPDMSGIHVINNTCLIVMGLLAGKAISARRSASR
jgi:ADP-ribosylglycohydrolase